MPVCEKCGGELVTRSDDTPDAIRFVFQLSRKKLSAVINDYKSRGLMLDVKTGRESIGNVTKKYLKY